MRNFINKFIATRIIKKIETNFDGNLIVRLPDNKSFVIGNEKNALIINVISYKFFSRLFFKGVADIGYSYSKGEWNTKDLLKLLEIGLKNANHFKSAKIIHNFRLLKGINSIFPNNSIRKSKQQISFHYDIGNKFYEKWLDKTMTYSSAIFKKNDDTLERAQINKYNNLIELLNIKKSDTVLEIGCGWGGFIRYVQDNIGSTITGITISKSQYKYTRELIKKNNKVLFLDYRNLNKTYDKIVSIEMFEAVGIKNWDKYFKILYKSLNKKGVAALQIITIDEKVFPSYKYSRDFIQKYIFPGGMLPTKNHLIKLAKKNQLEILEKKSFSEDYAKTLRLWREKFLNKWKDIEVLGYDDNFKRLWEFYLCYCEIGFKQENIDVSQFLINKE